LTVERQGSGGTLPSKEQWGIGHDTSTTNRVFMVVALCRGAWARPAFFLKQRASNSDSNCGPKAKSWKCGHPSLNGILILIAGISLHAITVPRILTTRRTVLLVPMMAEISSSEIQNEIQQDSVQFSTARYVWLWLGLATVGGMVGFLTGASNSPVVGTVISGLFGGVFGFVGGLIVPGRKKEG
jgi:hypothetical protein